jgi:hypothetical protein
MAGLEQRPVVGGELGRGEPLERKVAETWNEVSFDALLVAQPGGWPDPRRPHGREPLFHQEAAECALGGRDEGPGPDRGQGVVERLLALFLGPEPALAALPALARNRVGVDE